MLKQKDIKKIETLFYGLVIICIVLTIIGAPEWIVTIIRDELFVILFSSIVTSIIAGNLVEAFTKNSLKKIFSLLVLLSNP